MYIQFSAFFSVIYCVAFRKLIMWRRLHNGCRVSIHFTSINLVFVFSARTACEISTIACMFLDMLSIEMMKCAPNATCCQTPTTPCMHSDELLAFNTNIFYVSVIAFVYGCGISCLFGSLSRKKIIIIEIYTHRMYQPLAFNISLFLSLSPFSFSPLRFVRYSQLVLGTPYGKRATIHQYSLRCTPARQEHERDIILLSALCLHAFTLTLTHTETQSNRIPSQGVRKGPFTLIFTITTEIRQR